MLSHYVTPDEAFWGKKPLAAKLHEFGNKCWVLQQDGKNSKLDPKSRPFIFTGLSQQSRAYRYWDKETKKIKTSRNVIFSQTHPPQLEGEQADDKLPVDDDC